VRWARS